MDIKTTIINKIFNMNKRKLGIYTIMLLVTILILFPFIDTNFFYPNRVKNRIDILQKMTELDMDKIQKDEIMLKEYDSILKEINESDNNYVNKVLNNKENNHILGKFISGGSLWWILGIIMLLFYDKLIKDGKSKKSLGTRIAVFAFCIIFGALIGAICSVIPTISNIWVNYIFVPILVFILMLLLLYKNDKSLRSNQNIKDQFKNV